MANRTPDRAGSAFREQSFAALKEQQLVFLLTRHLAEAQFVQADRQRSGRLWQEVAALEIDPERVTALLYGVSDHSDRLELEAVDQQFLSGEPVRHGFWSPWTRRSAATGRWRGAWPRNARSADPQARRQAH